MNLATIDIGTNTTLLLVARARARRRRCSRSARRSPGSAAASGASGALDAEAIARTLAVLREFAAAARRHDARIAAVGTEALRRAANAAAFLDPAAEILGTEVEVIDGEREAALTFRAVVASFPEPAHGRARRRRHRRRLDRDRARVERPGRVSNQPAARIRAADGSASFITIRRRAPSGEAIAGAVDAAIRAVPFSRRARDAGRRRRHGDVAGGHGARARELRPRARPRLPAVAAPTSAVRSRAWAARPRRSASG